MERRKRGRNMGSRDWPSRYPLHMRKLLARASDDLAIGLAIGHWPSSCYVCFTWLDFVSFKCFHDPKWSLNLHITCERANSYTGPWKEPVGGHYPKWSSNLHVTYGCGSSQTRPWKEPVQGHDPKWSSNFHITCGHVSSLAGSEKS